MAIKDKGKQVLEKAKYPEIEAQVVKKILEHIKEQGKIGEDIEQIIGRVLHEKEFTGFLNMLEGEIKKVCKLSDVEAEDSATILVTESVSPKVLGQFKNIIAEQSEQPYKKMRLLEALQQSGIYTHMAVKKTIGRRIGYIKELFKIFKEHRAMLYLIQTGVLMLAIAAYLLGSMYDALTVTFTLTDVPAATFDRKIGVILAAMAGFLILFTSFSLIVHHFTSSTIEEERIREVAGKLLEEMNNKK